jgi:hypothetical protein
MSVEVLASEPIGGLVASLPNAVATVELDDSGTYRTGGGEEGRGVVSSNLFSCGSGVVGASGSGSGERGSMAFFSCIELTTFSRSMGVMCLPRALFTES